MTFTTESRPMQTARLDHTLEYAVVRSWDELMPDPKSGVIHIEYETGRDGSLDFVKIWASTIRGYWDLVCELWTRPVWSHETGLRFSNDYQAAKLARTLQLLIGHEDAFVKLPNRHGLIQVYPPTEKERGRAQCSTGVADDQHRSMPVERFAA